MESFKTSHLFTQTEGLVPAPETSHAIKSVIEQARKYPAKGDKEDGPVIVFCYSGHGYLDLLGYEKFLANQLENYPVILQAINESLQKLPLNLPKQDQIAKIPAKSAVKQFKMKRNNLDDETMTC